MKQLDADLLTEIAKENFTLNLLVEMFFDSTYRYTDADMDLYFRGDKFEKEAISIGQVRFSSSMSIDSLSLNFANANQAMTSIILNTDVVSAAIIVYLVARDSGGRIINYPTDKVFFNDRTSVVWRSRTDVEWAK
jgi:hypothetical protein